MQNNTNGESLEILEAFFLTLVGATMASVWDDIFHHPDDEAVLDNTLAYVRWMYSEWDGLSGWMGFRKARPRICLWSGTQFPNGAVSGNRIPLRT